MVDGCVCCMWWFVSVNTPISEVRIYTAKSSLYFTSSPESSPESSIELPLELPQDYTVKTAISAVRLKWRLRYAIY